MYATLNCDELNLNDYPSVNSLKSFKEKMSSFTRVPIKCDENGSELLYNVSESWQE